VRSIINLLYPDRKDADQEHSRLQQTSQKPCFDESADALYKFIMKPIKDILKQLKQSSDEPIEGEYADENWPT